MLRIIHFIIIALIGAVLLILGIQSISQNVNADAIAPIIGISLIYGIIFLIWSAIIAKDITETINDQITDFHSLEAANTDKKSYQEEMEAYKKEMKVELLTHYREFETTLMENIKDSKIIATILEKSGYANILKIYNSQIKSFLYDINNCERRQARLIVCMITRQSDRIGGYGRFIPLKYYYYPL